MYKCMHYFYYRFPSRHAKSTIRVFTNCLPTNHQGACATVLSAPFVCVSSQKPMIAQRRFRGQCRPRERERVSHTSLSESTGTFRSRALPATDDWGITRVPNFLSKHPYKQLTHESISIRLDQWGPVFSLV